MKDKKYSAYRQKAISPTLRPKTVATETHLVDSYGKLDVRTKPDRNKIQNKKKTNKQLDSLSHCQSLQKMQILTTQKNTQIQRFIYQNAELQSKNAELTEMLNNPTFHQYQLHLTIKQMQNKIDLLQKKLQQKEEEHTKEIQKIQKQVIKSQNKDMKANSSDAYRFSSYQYRNIPSKNSLQDATASAPKNQTYTFGAPTYISYPQTNREYVSTSPKYYTQNIDLPHSTQKNQINSYDSAKQYNKVYVYSQESTSKPIQILKGRPSPNQDMIFNNIKNDLLRSNAKVLKAVSKTEDKDPQKINYHSTYDKNGMEQIYKRYCISD